MGRFRFKDLAHFLLPILFIPLIGACLILIMPNQLLTITPAQPQLVGTRWELVSFGPPDEQVQPLPKTRLALIFGERIIRAQGCNSFYSDYIDIAFGTIWIWYSYSMTAVFCGGDIGEQDFKFIDAVRSAYNFSLDKTGEKLRIDYDWGRGVMHFVQLEQRP